MRKRAVGGEFCVEEVFMVGGKQFEDALRRVRHRYNQNRRHFRSLDFANEGTVEIVQKWESGVQLGVAQSYDTLQRSFVSPSLICDWLMGR
jgi:hypothetical protein